MKLTTCFFFFIFPLAELKQELQVRQRAIHEAPDNEKNGVDLVKEVKSIEGHEKSDPTKSPVVATQTVDSNKLPAPATPLTATTNGTPAILKCKTIWRNLKVFFQS